MTLYNSIGAVLQIYTVYFNVSALVENRGMLFLFFLTLFEDPKVEIKRQSADLLLFLIITNARRFVPTCISLLFGLYLTSFNIFCFLLNACWINLAQVLGVVMGVFAFVMLVRNIRQIIACCTPADNQENTKTVVIKEKARPGGEIDMQDMHTLNNEKKEKEKKKSSDHRHVMMMRRLKKRS